MNMWKTRKGTVTMKSRRMAREKRAGRRTRGMKRDMKRMRMAAVRR